jgi:hypothetical protein
MVGITRRSVSRVVGSVLVVIVVLLATATTASASANISVDPTTASPGDSVTIAGNVPTDGCPADDAAQLTSTAELFPPDGFGPPAGRDASGNFSIQYAVPASTQVGTYSIGVRCGGGNVGISAELEIVAAPVTTTITTAKATTTTTAPKTTTTTSTTTTTVASTLSSSSASASKSSSSALPWILLAIAAVVAAATVTYFVRSRRQT